METLAWPFDHEQAPLEEPRLPEQPTALDDANVFHFARALAQESARRDARTIELVFARVSVTERAAMDIAGELARRRAPLFAARWLFGAGAPLPIFTGQRLRIARNDVRPFLERNIRRKPNLTHA